MNAPSNPVSTVTGGGRGIGRSIACALAAEGMQVALLARSSDELTDTAHLIEDGGGAAVPYAVDITDEQAVDRVFEEIELALGPIELLVNAAGRHRGIGPIWEMEPFDWWRDIEVNLRGAYLCIRAALRGMQPRRRGRIVNLSSSAGNFPASYISGYGCSKAAVQHLTESVALELESYGIQVFALDPGLVWTSMSRHVIGSDACRQWMPDLSSVGPDDCVSPKLAAAQVVRLASGNFDVLSGRFVTYRTDLQAVADRIADVAQHQLYVLRLRGLQQT